jgi:WD40 repeat protein
MAPSGVTGSDRGWDIRLYDFATGELRALLKGHTDAVDGLAFSPSPRGNPKSGPE